MSNSLYSVHVVLGNNHSQNQEQGNSVSSCECSVLWLLKLTSGCYTLLGTKLRWDTLPLFYYCVPGKVCGNLILCFVIDIVNTKSYFAQHYIFLQCA